MKTKRKKWVCVPPDMSVFLLGSPSSGKTGSLIIPNILQWDGAVVSTSTKMDIAEACSRHRNEIGQVWIWAPLMSQAELDVELPQGAHRLNYSPISGSEERKMSTSLRQMVSGKFVLRRPPEWGG
jgi:hypothetical protein